MYQENTHKACLCFGFIILFLILLFHMMELNCLDLREKEGILLKKFSHILFYSTHSPS